MYLKSKKFIEELLPNDPILIDLLPTEAQKVVAKVHENTEPAKRILEQEGFKFNGLVGIFEPGPVLQAKLKNIRAYKDSKILKIASITEEKLDAETFIISTTGQEREFATCLGKLAIDDKGEGIISAVTATTLKLKLGDSLRFVKFKA